MFPTPDHESEFHFNAVVLTLRDFVAALQDAIAGSKQDVIDDLFQNYRVEDSGAYKICHKESR